MGSRSEAVNSYVHSAIGNLRFVPKFSRSVTSSTRSYQESETILAQPDPTPRIRPRAASNTTAFVEEGQ